MGGRHLQECGPAQCWHTVDDGLSFSCHYCHLNWYLIQSQFEKVSDLYTMMSATETLGYILNLSVFLKKRPSPMKFFMALNGFLKLWD